METDLFGGDLGVRLRTRRDGALPEAPTVLTVAAAARTSREPDLISRHAHHFTEAVSVVPGHLCAEQAAGGVDWEALGSALAASEVPVFVVTSGECRRRHPWSVSRPWLICWWWSDDRTQVLSSGLRERLNRLVPAMAGHRAARRGRIPRVYPLLGLSGPTRPS